MDLGLEPSPLHGRAWAVSWIRLDDSDWTAVEWGFGGTDAGAEAWFEYPVGRLTVKVGRENGHVLVHVDGAEGEDRLRLTWTAELMRNWFLTSRRAD